MKTAPTFPRCRREGGQGYKESHDGEGREKGGGNVQLPLNDGGKVQPFKFLNEKKRIEIRESLGGKGGKDKRVQSQCPPARREEKK